MIHMLFSSSVSSLFSGNQINKSRGEMSMQLVLSLHLYHYAS